MLEQRVLFSASPGQETLVPQPITADAGIESLASSATVDARDEYIFIDAGVGARDEMVHELLSVIGEHQHIVLLDADRDGLGQIAESLQGKHELGAIHLVSHGGDGRLRLGTTEVNSANLSHYAGELKQIGSSLALDGDILIYGCRLAASADGQYFVDQLGQLTSAEVAASDDLTGASEQQGDWELEFQTGGVEAESVAATAWQGTLSGPADVTWVLGDNGTKIDFSSGVPVVSDTPSSQFEEGFASWTDPGTGELVLYSNGSTVWNGQTNQILANGTGLSGDYRDAQPAAIVPVPGERDQFYLFQMNYSLFGRINYSIVDMGVGSNGSVTLKNQSVGIFEEAMDVIPHANGDDYWVLSYDRNTTTSKLQIEAVRFDENGEQETVRSDVELTDHSGGAERSFISHSTDNTKLLLGQVRHGDLATADFDPATGLASNSVLHITGVEAGYAAAFSPDATKFYYTLGNTGSNGTPHQYDLLTDTVTQLSTETGHSGPGLGPDGKVYFARINDTALSVVNDPNVAGAGSNFVFEGLDLTNGGAIPESRSGRALFNQVAVQPSVANGPLLTLDTSSLNGGMTTTLGLGSTASVDLTAPTASITDPDSAELVSFEVQASGILDGDGEILTIGGRAIPLGTTATYVSDVYGSTTFSMSYNAGTDVLSISNNGGGDMPIGDMELLLRSASYDRVGETTSGQRSFRFVVNDGSINSTAPTHTVTIGFQQVNTEDAFLNTDSPRIAVLNGGNYVIVWESLQFGGSDSWEVVGQMFDASGAKIGSNFIVSEFDDWIQRNVDVLALQDGGFATVYETTTANDTDFSLEAVAIRFFDANGAPRTGEFMVNTYTNSYQEQAAVSQLADGNVVVTWSSSGQDGSSWGIFGQMLDTSGAKIGSEFQVNSSTEYIQENSTIAALADGGFIVAWQDRENEADNFDTFGYGSYAQRFDASGNRVGGQFRLNETINDTQRAPDIVPHGDGFVAIWEGEGAGDSDGVYFRRFDEQGTPIGGETQVNLDAFGTQDHSGILPLADGGFYIYWEDFFDNSIEGRWLNENAHPLDVTDVTIDTSTSALGAPDIAQLPNGNLVATYINSNNEIFVREILHSGTPTTIDGLADLAEPLNRIPYTTLGVPVHVDQGATSTISNFAPTADPYRLEVSVINGDTTNDLVTLEDQGIGAGQIGRSGINVTYEGSVIGTYNNMFTGDGFVVILSVTPTAEMLEALIQATTFTANDPGTGHDFGIRDIRFEILENGQVLTGETVEIAVTPLQQEFLVNTLLQNQAQSDVDVIKLADGNYVVSWQDEFADGDEGGTIGRIYSPDGIPVTERFFLNTQSRDFDQQKVKISALDTGGFVATWLTATRDDSDSDYAIAAQIFTADGAPVGDEIRVNTTLTGDQLLPDVVGLSGGQFMITWDGNNGVDPDGIAAQVFDATGAKVGGELDINTNGLGAQVDSRIAQLSDGNAVVVWQTGDNVAFRRYDSSGNPLDATEQVATNADGIQESPTVVAFQNGFAIAWNGAGVDDMNGVYLQRFANDGTAIGSPTLLNQTTAGAQEFVDLVATDSLIGATWTGNGTTGTIDDTGVWFRAFSQSGAPVSDETLINTTTIGDQTGGALVGGRSNDEFFFVWQSDQAGADNAGNSDGSETGIFSRVATITLEGLIDLDADDSSGATLFDYTSSFNEGGSGPSSLADTDIVIVDTNGGAYDSLDLTISGLLDANNEFLHLGGQTFDLSTDVVAPQTVTVGSVGYDVTYNSSTGAFTVVRNGGGTMDIAELSSVIGDFAYSHSATPTEGPRTITWTADEGGSVTQVATTTMEVWQFNAAPTIAVDAVTPYIQGMPEVAVDPSITIADIDDSAMHAAIVSLADVDRIADQLTLSAAASSAAATAGIAVTPYNPGNGQLRLSGAAAIADYESVLEGVEFFSLSTTPGNRAVDFVIEDLRNSSNPGTATIQYTVDTTPPTTPTLSLDLPAAQDSGLHDDDNITNVAAPTFTIPAGSATPGDMVTILANGLSIGTTTVLADGSVAFTPTADLLDGSYDLTYTLTDQAGNTSGSSPVLSVVIDTVAPARLHAIYNRVTNDSTPPITGASSPGALEYVELEVNGQFYNLGVTNGLWTHFIPPEHELADGTYPTYARIFDLAGNFQEEDSGVTVDTVAPAVPTVNPLVVADRTPQLTGTVVLEPGEILRVTVDGQSFTDSSSQLTVVGNDWTLDVPTDIMPDGVYEVVARVDDAAGNQTFDTTTGELTIDLLEPAIPTVDSLSTNDTTPAITGTSILETGESLEVTVNGVTYSSLLGEISFTGSTWTVVIPPGNELPEGTFEVVAFATDGAGNNSTDTTTDELFIDTTPPAIPTVNSQMSADTTPLITGTATVAADETLTVRVDGITYPVGSNLSLVGTDWSLQIPAIFDITPSGTYEVVAAVTDPVGNVSTDTTTGEFVLDMLDPPTVDNLATSDSTPAITGTVSIDQGAGETLDVTVNGVTYNLGDGNLGVTGSTWTLTIPAGSELSDGTYDIVAVVSDVDSNTASDSSSNELLIDTVAPVIPTVNSQSTADSTPVITGTATVGAGESFRVDFNGRTYFEFQSALTLTGTDWSLQIPLADAMTTNGTYEVTAVVDDPAGNQSTDTTVGELIFDTTAPDVPSVDSQTTNDDTPAITGTATLAADETLSVEVDGVTYNLGDGNLGITGTTWTLVVPTGNEIPDGTYEVLATATDAAGNSNVDTSNNELSIDTVVPAIPTVNSQVSNDSTPFMTGTAVVGAGETLTVHVNGIGYSDSSPELTVAGTNWSLQIPTIHEFTSDGVYEVTATVSDPAGNAATDTTTGEFTYDTVLPDAPLVDTLASNDTTPAITGSANLAADETLAVEVNGVTYTLGDGNLGMSGSTWTLVVPPGNELADGAYEVVATTSDPLGNANTDATTNELTIDTVAPATPTVNTLISNDPTPLLTGTATVGANEELRVRVNGFTYYDWSSHLTLAGTDWSLQIPSLFEFTANGVYEVEAYVTDTAGNETSDTTLGEFTFDTVLPNSPVVDFLATNDTTPAISGTANLAADETLAVGVNGVTYNLGDGNLGISGSTWTLIIPTGNEIAEGTYEVVATATDSLGNTNSDSTTNELTIDITPPAVPTVNSQISNDPTPFLTGTATVGPGESFSVHVNGVTHIESGPSLTLAGTNWSLQISPAHEFTSNGVYEVVATVSDPAGNVTTDATTGEFTFDTVLPDAPVVNALATNDTTPAITGTANLLADETLAVEVNGVTYTQGDGNLGMTGSNWTLVIPTGNELPEGTYEVTATATDSLGNTNNDVTTDELVVDLTPPVVPTVNALISNDPTPLLTGTAILEAGDELRVLVNGVNYRDFDPQLTVTGTNWSLQIPTIHEFTSNGVYEVEATIEDLAGNASTDTTLGEFTYDTSLPDAPTVDFLATNDTTPAITGTATLAADETLAVEVNGVTYTLGDGNLGMSGSNWTLVIPAGNELTEASWDVHATVTDSIGNINNDATSGELVIDLTPPAAPTVNALISNDPTPILTGTAAALPDDTLSVRVNGFTYFAGGPHLALAGTNWSLQVPTIGEFTSDGVYEVEATLTDLAGNQATDTTLGEFTYDTVLPDAPTVDPLATNDTTPAITGTANLLADEVLTVLLDGVNYTLGDGNLGITGSTWSLVVPTGNELAEATYDVHATVTDSLGNANNDATSAELVIDLTPPAVPTAASLISNDPTPLLTGTAAVAADETLTVHVNGVTYFDGDGHLTVAGTNWSLQIPTLFEFTSNGTYDVTATVTDLAGNATGDTTLGEFTFDTVLPDAPTVNPLATNDTTPAITGTANLLADESLTVEVDGVTYAVGDGNLGLSGSAWTLVIPPGNELTEATWDVTARVTDSIGNTNSDATSGELVVDITPPSVPTVNTLSSNDPTPFLTGTAIVGPGETLSVTANGVTYFEGDTHLSLSGTSWSLQVPTVFEYTTDGTYDIQATVTDVAGNATSDATLGEFTLDTSLPSAPVVNPLFTNDTSPAITGVVNLAADETLAVEVNGVTYNLGDGNLGITGSNWTLVIPPGNELAEGTYDVHATITNSFGNANNDTTSGELVIDLTPPPVPTVNSLISNDPTPLLTGTATVTPGESLSVQVNGITYVDGDTHLALAGPNWSLQIPTTFEFTADGVYNVTATVTDPAGNSAMDTTLGEFTLDTVLPDAPIVHTLVTNDTTPTLTGTANLAGDETLRVAVDGVTYTQGDGNLSVSGSAAWTLHIPISSDLLEGTYEVHATVTDSLGNTNTDATTNELLIDLTPPASPTVNSLVSNDPTPVLTGTAVVAANETLTVTVNGRTYVEGDSHLTLAGTNWSLQIPVSAEFTTDGTYEVVATATDLAGNAATDTTIGDFTYDTTPPAAPTVDPQLTNDVTPTLTGTANLLGGDSLSIALNGNIYTLGDGNLEITGSTWSLAIPPGDDLPEGTYDVHATAIDPVGNVSSDSTTNELVIDLTPPIVPTVISQTTNDSTPVISGTATVAADETLIVQFNGGSYFEGDSQLTTAGPVWSLQVPTAFEMTSAGSYDVSATVFDLAGNAASDTTTGEVTYDPTLPDAPTVQPQATNDATPTITGTATLAPGETLSVEVDGQTYFEGTDLVIVGNDWSLTIPAGQSLADGTYDVHAVVTDGLGSANNDTTSNELMIDLTPPAVPSANSFVSNNPTPLLSGSATLDPGDSLSVTVDGTTYSLGDGNLTFDGSNWALQIPAIFALGGDGAYDVTVTVTDLVGNASTDPTSGEYVLDTQPPAQPTVNFLTANDDTPTLSGTAVLVPGETLTVEANGTTYFVGDGNLSMTGSTWSLQVPTANAFPGPGTYDITATVADPIGNASTDVTTGEFTFSAGLPTPPTVDPLSTNDPTPTLTGNAILDTDESLTVMVDGVAYTVGDGNLSLVGNVWQLQIPASNPLSADGTYEVVATVSDTLGNAATDVTSGELTLDTTPPIAPTVNPQSTNDNTPTITGSANLAAGETLAVNLNGVSYVPGDGNLVVGGGTWSLTIAPADVLADGTFDVVAIAADAVGNSSSDSTINELLIDTTPPAVPTVTFQSSNDSTPLITGAAALGPGEVLSVTMNSQTYVAGGGNLSVVGSDWMLRIPPADVLPADGTYEVVATVTDSVGNSSSDTTIGEFVLDSTLPNVPNVYFQLTNSPVPAITGTANLAAGESLSVTVDGNTYVPGDGNLTLAGSDWTLSIPTTQPLSEGAVEVTATISDGLGSNSDTTTNELTVDLTPPVTPTVDPVSTNSNAPLITGSATLGPGESLSVVVDGVTYVEGDGNLTVTGSTWALQVPSTSPLTPGTYDVTAIATDAAGNVSNDATVDELSVDGVGIPIFVFDSVNDFGEDYNRIPDAEVYPGDGDDDALVRLDPASVVPHGPHTTLGPLPTATQPTLSTIVGSDQLENDSSVFEPLRSISDRLQSRYDVGRLPKFEIGSEPVRQRIFNPRIRPHSYFLRAFTIDVGPHESLEKMHSLNNRPLQFGTEPLRSF